MKIDLITLKMFLAAYEEQSIARAADREHIAASALSRRLSDLEISMKVTLFQRNRSGLEPTAAANALVRHARRVIHDVDQLESELADYSKGLRGRIKIYSTVWGMIQYLPDDLASFLSMYPDVQIEVEERTTAATLQSVRENAADIGIIEGNVPSPELQVLSYRCDPLVAVLPAHHPLAQRPSLLLADILPFEVIGAERGSPLDLLMLNAATALGRTIDPRIRVSGSETICRMVESGLGIGFVAKHCVDRWLSTMKIVTKPLPEPWALRRLNLCISSEQQLSRAGMLLIEHLSGQQAEFDISSRDGTFPDRGVTSQLMLG